ncbi:MAG: flagellar basal body P-ring protein FlgI [Pirellulaceae bacterium]|nr:flagellar basal body P-ring protein FlgI [Pirellulaceae bacterium]
MKPTTSRPRLRWDAGISLLAALLLSGCTSQLLMTSSDVQDAKTLAELEPEPEDNGALLVKDVSVPWGLNHIALEGVGLVTGLDKTGSDPPPSPQRTALISDMQTYEVKNPNLVLGSPETSLVLVRCLLPPGVQKGDRYDVEIRVPSKSETSSLRSGWLMRSRLRETAVLDNALHSGHVESLAEGRVLIDAVFEGPADEIKETRGRVMGGGVALTSRPIGLVVQSEQHSIRTSSQVGAVINARFHTYDRGIKRGVATPKRDNFVQLEVHPRYKHNLVRYVRIVQNIALGESPSDRVSRLEQLERKLLEPATSAAAALQLEAVGKEAIRILKKGLASGDAEVRFYSAEALAYLDEAPAADVLADTARTMPAFRWHAIAALSAMDNVGAYDALADLFHVPSAETRYAAFRALRTKNPLDPVVRGQSFADHFTYHTLDTTGPSMIHLARSRVPEIVVFGQDLELRPPAFLYAGKKIMLKDAGGGRIKVSRFAASEEDRQQVCSNQLDDVVRTIVEVGGSYDDVAQCLLEAKRKEYLDARVVVDALPRVNRTHRRTDSSQTAEAPAEDDVRKVASPMPDLFRDRSADSGEDEAWESGDRESHQPPDVDPSSDEKEDGGFLGKVKAWF